MVTKGGYGHHMHVEDKGRSVSPSAAHTTTCWRERELSAGESRRNEAGEEEAGATGSPALGPWKGTGSPVNLSASNVRLPHFKRCSWPRDEGVTGAFILPPATPHRAAGKRPR